MLSFFKFMAPLVIFRRGPADMPYSTLLLWLSVTVVVVLDIVATLILGADMGRSLLALSLQVGFSTAAITLLLALWKKRRRWLQTMIALFGASAVLFLAQVLVILFARAGLPADLVNLLFQCLLLWSLAVDGFIIAAALAISMPLGFVLSLAIFIPQAALLEQMLRPG